MDIISYSEAKKAQELAKQNKTDIVKVEEDLTAHKEEFTQLNGEERLTILEESKVKKYGVKFLGSNPVGERLYDAIGMVANVAVDDEVVVNDFDNVSFFDRPICNVYFDTNGNPQVMAYRGEPGFSFEGGIFPPYAEKSDVYYECSPCGWNGSFDTPVVTGTPMEGFELFECFPDWNTKIYLPTYFMGMEDGRPTSRSGVKPGYYSINTAFTTAQAWNTNAHGETINAHMYEYILQCIEFATRDLQTVMYGVGALTYNSETDLASISETGVNRIILARANNYAIGQTIVVGTARNGDNVTGERIVTSIEPYDENGQALYFDGEPVNIGIGNFVSSRAYKNGETDIVVASSGSPVDNTSGKYPCIWRGKADPWGNGYSGISDLLTKRYGAGTPEDPYTYKLCYLKNPKKYANGVITSDYIELNYNLPTSDGFAKELDQDTRFPLIGFAKEIGAASTTYYADYYYYPRNDVGAVFVGGHFSLGRFAGPLYFNCSNTPAFVYFGCLARLFVTPF